MNSVGCKINGQKPGSEQTMDLLGMVKLVVRRKWVFVITVILCLLIGILYVCIKKPLYEYKQMIQPATYLSSFNAQLSSFNAQLSSFNAQLSSSMPTSVQRNNFQSANKIMQLTKFIYLPYGIKKLNRSLSANNYISSKMVDVDLGSGNAKMEFDKNNFIVLTAKGTKQDRGKFEKLFSMILANIQQEENEIILQNKRVFNAQLLNTQNRIAYLDNDKKVLSKELTVVQRDTQEANVIQNAMIQYDIIRRIQQDSDEYFTYKALLNKIKIKLNNIANSRYLSSIVVARSFDDISKWLVILFFLMFGIMFGFFVVLFFEFIGEVKNKRAKEDM